MRGLERAIRPIMENGVWDYCVLWKLGDDPNRFIEWFDCCCIAARSQDFVKEENQTHKAPFCRDTRLEHPVRTMACRALANFPAFMPLYSGVHGDVVLTNQPMWLDQANRNDSASHLSNEEVGTRVLVPVGGGLIEFFAGKHIERDERFIDFVRAHSAQCTDIINVETVMGEQRNAEGSFTELPRNLLHEPLLKIEPLSMQFYDQSSLTYPIFEGSSSISNYEPLSDPLFSHASHYADFEDSKNVENPWSQGTGSLEDRDLVAGKKNVSGRRYPARNLITERNRRVRIRGGLYALRALVPNISKMDKSSILGDAIDYIEELKKKIMELEDELKETGEEDREENSGELKMSKSDNPSVCTRGSPATEIQNVISCGEQKHLKVSVDIHQMGKREFLIKIIREKEQGFFVRLVQALNTLRFQVVDVNVTTSRGTVLYILKIEGCKEDIELKTLRKTLVEFTTG